MLFGLGGFVLGVIAACLFQHWAATYLIVEISKETRNG